MVVVVDRDPYPSCCTVTSQVYIACHVLPLKNADTSFSCVVMSIVSSKSLLITSIEVLGYSAPYIVVVNIGAARCGWVRLMGIDAIRCPLNFVTLFVCPCIHFKT